MTLKEINTANNRIVGSLDSRELKSAFETMQSFLLESKQHPLQDRLNELQETYKRMLHYQVNGIHDPKQNDIYRRLTISAYEMADLLKFGVSDKESPLQFYSQRRFLNTQPETSYSELNKLLNQYDENNAAMYEATEVALFHKIWTSGRFSQSDTEEVRDILTDILPFTTGCQVITALFLSLQESFDVNKLLLLMEAAVHAYKEVSVRALICILITLYIYRKRTDLYPEINVRLASLAEKQGFKEIVRTITMRFILARETEKITRKLQDEILPEMMKLSPKLSRKINLKDFAQDMMGDEINPEWQNILSEGTLGKKMEEIGELQQEGADVMHSTFAHLKQFSFFREISSWMMPFIPTHSLLNESKGSKDDKQMLETLSMAPFMCNSDKYSLCFSMMQLPEAHRKMMMSQFTGQTAEMLQQCKEALTPIQDEEKIIISHYIQDLYRFYKLHPSHLDFEDIFALPLDFHNLPILDAYISDEVTLNSIAELYMNKNYFDEALIAYDRLARSGKTGMMVYQKRGYCKQMKGDIEGALEDYLHADLVDTESKWLIRRIAGCYRTLKQPEKALTYYHRYEALNPDNLSVLTNIGHCHLELKEYSEALKYYFKVDYLDTKGHKAWRPIAWCSFLTKKYDQAQNYYKKILEDQPNMEDLLNAGHTEWVLGNTKEALTYYKQAVQLMD
ncbi:MAG: tetratricopeptide repeat protein, partial [Tannerellaceae bacterium]